MQSMELIDQIDFDSPNPRKIFPNISNSIFYDENIINFIDQYSQLIEEIT